MRPSPSSALFMLLAALAWAGCERAATDAPAPTDGVTPTADATTDSGARGGWWTDVAADATAPDSLADDPDDKPGDKPGDKPSAGGTAVVYSGLVDLNTLTGTMTTEYFGGESESPSCAWTQDMTDLTESDDCAGCQFGFTTSLTAGEATVGAGDSLCAQNTVFLLGDAGIGHGEDGTLYMNFGKGEDGLQAVDGGSSETNEAIWTFSFSYSFGDGGDKEGDDGDNEGDGGDKDDDKA